MRWSLLTLSLAFFAGSCGDDDPVGTVEAAFATRNLCDVDGDGYLAPSCGGDDCDDHNPLVYPGHGCERTGGGCTWPPCADPGPISGQPQVDSAPTMSTLVPSSGADDSPR